MTALNDAGRKSSRDGAGGSNRALPVHVGRGDMQQNGKSPAFLPSWNFIAAVIAIGGMQLLATMDSTVAIVALPKIQDELGLSDAGRSWVITALVPISRRIASFEKRITPDLFATNIGKLSVSAPRPPPRS